MLWCAIVELLQCNAVEGMGVPYLCISIVAMIALNHSYLVDPASNYMLVSKINPCMSKNKCLYSVNLRTAHYISNDLFDGTLLLGYP